MEKCVTTFAFNRNQPFQRRKQSRTVLPDIISGLFDCVALTTQFRTLYFHRLYKNEMYGTRLTCEDKTRLP